MPPFPEGAAYLWQCFLRLRRRTASGINGHEPISWPALDAFIRRAGIRLAPWEVEIIEMLDDVFLSGGKAAPATPDGKVKEAASTADGAGVKAVMGALGNRRRVVRRRRNG